MIINVRDLGAVGDGVHVETDVFRRATEAAQASAEAAVIVVPPGCYVCGTIDLPSHTTLHLEAGATLKASTDIRDFKRNPFIFRNRNLPPDSHLLGQLPFYFIGSHNQEEVIIDGDGTIDGSGDAFWEKNLCTDGLPLDEKSPNRPAEYRVLKPKPQRPVVISLWKCKKVVIRNVKINNASAYTVWPQGCDDVRIQDISIRNSFFGPNTDALDIDCSSNVMISGCYISAGDDCIALKSDSSRICEDKPCENVLVTNCVLSSNACGVRIGYEGDAAIRDCSFSNIVIYDAKNGLDLISITPMVREDFIKGTDIERIIFSNVVMRNVCRPLFVWSGTANEKTPIASHIDGLTFSNIDAYALNGSFIGAIDGSPIRNLSLQNVRIHLNEHPYFKAMKPLDLPGVWGSGRIPDVLRLHRVDKCTLNSVNLSREESDCQRKQEGHALLRWNQASQFRLDNALQAPDGSLFG